MQLIRVLTQYAEALKSTRSITTNRQQHKERKLNKLCWKLPMLEEQTQLRLGLEPLRSFKQRNYFPRIKCFRSVSTFSSQSTSKIAAVSQYIALERQSAYLCTVRLFCHQTSKTSVQYASLPFQWCSEQGPRDREPLGGWMDHPGSGVHLDTGVQVGYYNTWFSNNVMVSRTLI